MCWLVVGLGNPGERYNNTRHNAGFLAVEAMASERGLRWKAVKKLDGWMAETGELKLLKPGTFMNASGHSVNRAMHYLRLVPRQLIVIHDDLDLSLGNAKVSWAKGPHIHNGLLSVEAELGTHEFWRVRIGVDNRSPEERRAIPGEKYVLKPLLIVEQRVMEEGVAKAVAIVDRIMRGEYAASG